MHTPSTPTKPEPLPVIFRKHFERGGGSWKDGRWIVTAAFPTLHSDSSNWYNFTCYAHIGQHGSASPQWFRKGQLARPAEYADLLAELRGIYENDPDWPCVLKVYQRETPQHRAAREAAWRESEDDLRKRI